MDQNLDDSHRGETRGIRSRPPALCVRRAGEHNLRARMTVTSPAGQAVSGDAGQMGAMTRQEAIDFMCVGSRTGKLATASPGGKPHVAPVWFVVEGDELVFTTNEQTVKGRNLRANPQAALTVDVSEYPYAFAVVRGSVTLERQAPDLLVWTTRIAERYVPAQLAGDFGKRNAVEGEVLCQLHIGRISGVRDIAL